MALTKSLVDIPITSGIDTGTDQRLTARMLEVTNMRQDKLGTLTKRFGTNSFGAGTELRNGQSTGLVEAPPLMLAGVDDQLVMAAANTIDSRVTGSWSLQGPLPGMFSTVESVGVQVPADTTFLPFIGVDVAQFFTTTFVAYGGPTVFAVDSQTGATISSHFGSPAAGNTPTRVAVCGDTILVLYVNAATGLLNYVKIVSAAGLFSSTTGVFAGAADYDFMYSFGLESDGNAFFVVYSSTTAHTYKVKRFDTALTVTHTQSITTAAGQCTYASLSVGGGQVWAIGSFEDPAGVTRVRCYSTANLTPLSAAQTVNGVGIGTPRTCTILRISATEALAVFTQYDLLSKYFVVRKVDLAGTVNPVTYLKYINCDISISCLPFTASNGRHYVTVTSSTLSELYTSTSLVDLQYGSTYIDSLGLPPQLACTTLPRRIYANKYTQPCRTIVDGNDALYYQVNPGRFAVISGSPDVPDISDSTLFAVRYTLPDANTRSASIDGSSLVVTAGAPVRYDGSAAVEIGFVCPPIGNTASLDTSTGTLPDGLYTYTFCYVYRYADGKIERSLPSAPLEFTVTGSPPARVSLQIALLPLSYKVPGFSPSRVLSVEIYRNGSVGDAVPRLLASVNATAAAYATGYIAYNDNQTTIPGTRPVLYTYSGELDNVNPPSAKYSCAWGLRTVLAGTDDDRIWYSKITSDVDPPCFNEGLTIDPYQGGRVIGVGILDDKLLIFKGDSVWACTGDGPNNLGQGATLSLPQSISTSVGCVAHKSIINTQSGTFFQGSDGLIYLVNRSLQISDVGRDLQGILQFPAVDYICTGAVVLPEQNHVRFSFTNSVGVGLTLNYDTRNGMWSSYNLPDGASGYAYKGINASCLGNVDVNGASVGKRYVFAFASGNVVHEGDATNIYYDIYAGGSPEAVWVTASIRTGFMKTAGLQGYQRTYRLGMLLERHEDCEVTGSFISDYNTAYNQSFFYSAPSMDGMSDPLELQVRVVRQKSQAIQVFWADAPDSQFLVPQLTGQGYTITGFRVQYGIKQGMQPVGASKRR